MHAWRCEFFILAGISEGFERGGGECDAAGRVCSGLARKKYVLNQISIERYRASPTLTVLMSLESSDTSEKV